MISLARDLPERLQIDLTAFKICWACERAKRSCRLRWLHSGMRLSKARAVTQVTGCFARLIQITPLKGERVRCLFVLPHSPSTRRAKRLLAPLTVTFVAIILAVCFLTLPLCLRFVWKGQENYDAVGEAVNATIREMLVTHCKLVEVVTDLAPASCWASPDWREHRGPTLVLVCGNTPGGEAGVWGRALCVNQTTLQGAMFDYIARARAKGWAVVVADPHTDATPHLHVIRLMEGPLKSKQRLLVVAHSYGAPCTLGMVCILIKIIASSCSTHPNSDCCSKLL